MVDWDPGAPLDRNEATDDGLGWKEGSGDGDGKGEGDEDALALREMDEGGGRSRMRSGGED